VIRYFFGLTATLGSREVSLKSIYEAPGRNIILYVTGKFDPFTDLMKCLEILNLQT